MECSFLKDLEEYKSLKLDLVINPNNKQYNLPYKEKGVIILDIETNIGNIRTKQEKEKLDFICGIIYDYKINNYIVYDDPKKLIKKIKSSKVIITFNGEQFDYLVLKKYGLKLYCDYKPIKIKSIDIMKQINQLSKNNTFFSLEEIIFFNYKERKKDYDHNNMDELIFHCKEDVRFTKLLYEDPFWLIPDLSKSKYDDPKYYENQRMKLIKRKGLEKKCIVCGDIVDIEKKFSFPFKCTANIKKNLHSYYEHYNYITVAKQWKNNKEEIRDIFHLINEKDNYNMEKKIYFCEICYIEIVSRVLSSLGCMDPNHMKLEYEAYQSLLDEIS